MIWQCLASKHSASLLPLHHHSSPSPYQRITHILLATPLCANWSTAVRGPSAQQSGFLRQAHSYPSRVSHFAPFHQSFGSYSTIFTSDVNCLCIRRRHICSVRPLSDSSDSWLVALGYSIAHLGHGLQLSTLTHYPPGLELSLTSHDSVSSFILPRQKCFFHRLGTYTTLDGILPTPSALSQAKSTSFTAPIPTQRSTGTCLRFQSYPPNHKGDTLRLMTTVTSIYHQDEHHSAPAKVSRNPQVQCTSRVLCSPVLATAIVIFPLTEENSLPQSLFYDQS